MKKIAPDKRVRRSRKETLSEQRPQALHRNTPLEENLAFYALYINHLLRQKITPALEEDVKDAAQTALITLWSKLFVERVKIDYPKAYISFIVRSRWSDVARQRQRQAALPLPETEDGEELPYGNVLLFPGEGMSDPALEYERKEFLEEVVGKVVQLPAAQLKAMICLLKDEVGETFPLIETFATYSIDIRSIEWPDDRYERQKLLSSLSVARQKLRSFFTGE